MAGLTAITLDDVKKFYATHYARNRLVVGVAGGYPAGFAEAFAKRFAALPAKAPPLPKLPPAPVLKDNQLLIVQKDARANAISIGHTLDVTRKDADFYPLTVARSYLGEHRTFNGVLMNHLRGNRGLNYGDYAYIENFIQDGWSTFPLPNIPRREQHFEIWLRPVPPQNSLFALRAALYETDKLIRDGIPQAGFEATKTFLANYANLWAQDVSRRLGFAIDAVVTGKDLVKELQARLPKMTKADVDKAVRKHLSLNGLAIAIVADHGTGAGRQAAQRHADADHLRHGRHAARGAGRGQDHREVPGAAQQGRRPRRAGRSDVREIAAARSGSPQRAARTPVDRLPVRRSI